MVGEILAINDLNRYEEAIVAYDKQSMQTL